MTDPLDRPAIRLLAIEALHRSIGLLNEPAYARLRQEPERDLAFADLELDSLSTLEMLMEIEEAVDNRKRVLTALRDRLAVL